MPYWYWKTFQEGSEDEKKIKWNAEIENNPHCVFARGEWLLPMFMGIVLDRRKTEEQVQETKRTKKLTNTEDAAVYQEVGAKLLDEYHSSGPVIQSGTAPKPWVETDTSLSRPAPFQRCR